MPDESQPVALARPMETLVAVIGALLGTDSPTLLLAANATEHTIALPEGWPTRALSDRDSLLVGGPLGPVVVLPRWERRPLNSLLPSLVDDVRAALGLGGVAVVLLPSSELESARSDELRSILLEYGLSAVCLLPVTGVHTSFIGAAVLLTADAHEFVRYFDAHSAARSNSVEGVARELGRLLRMKGGATEHGYVLRDKPDPHNLGFRRNDPRLGESRAALAEYGSAVRIDELFDLVPFVHPLEARRRPSTGDMEHARLLSGRDLQFGRIVGPDEDSPQVPVSPRALLRVGDLVLEQ